MEVLRFKHPYYKLKSNIFPTCRGKSTLRKYSPDTPVQIIDPSGEYIAVIIDATWRRIEDLSLAFLKIDGNYPGHDIKDHHDFVDLLNSFRRFNKIKSIEEEVTVLWLMTSPSNKT